MPGSPFELDGTNVERPEEVLRIPLNDTCWMNIHVKLHGYLCGLSSYKGQMT